MLVFIVKISVASLFLIDLAHWHMHIPPFSSDFDNSSTDFWHLDFYSSKFEDSWLKGVLNGSCVEIIIFVLDLSK